MICDRCNNQVKENKEFEANLYFLKREPPLKLVICLLILKNKMICL